MSAKNQNQTTETTGKRRQKLGLLVVMTLVVLTLTGHLMTRDTAALPTPSDDGFKTADALVSLAGRLDRTAVLLGGDDQVKMELTLRAPRLPEQTVHTPVDIIVVLDRSGSMASDDKMVSARSAIDYLISGLRPGDRMALVAFANDAQVLIPLSETTPLAQESWRRMVAGIGPNGGTNMSAGLDVALQMAAGIPRSMSPALSVQRSRRVLLISDGEANQGDATPEGLRRRAAEAARQELVLSSIGVGLQFNEYLLAALADAGTGNYYYADDMSRLAVILADEFSAGRETVASGLALTIDPAPGVEVLDMAGYPGVKQPGRAVTYEIGPLFAGQERRLWVTLRVPNGEPGDYPLGLFRATYIHGGEPHALEIGDLPQIACVGDRDTWLGAFDRAAWTRSVVEEDLNRLRQEVARYVKDGQRDEALRKIESYETSNRALNETLGSEEVDASLEDAKRLEAEVEDAFSGEGQAAKQNALSKKQQSVGRDLRRSGSKKGGSR